MCSSARSDCQPRTPPPAPPDRHALPTAGRLGAPGSAPLEFTAHTYRRAESGLRIADQVEAHPFIEPLRGAGSHLETFGTMSRRARSRVVNERSADTSAHASRFDEQPVQLVGRTVRWNDDREADGRSFVVDRDAHQLAIDEGLGQLDRIRVGRELLAVCLPDAGGSPL